MYKFVQVSSLKKQPDQTDTKNFQGVTVNKRTIHFVGNVLSAMGQPKRVLVYCDRKNNMLAIKPSWSKNGSDGSYKVGDKNREISMSPDVIELYIGKRGRFAYQRKWDEKYLFQYEE